MMDRSDRYERQILDMFFADEGAEPEDLFFALRSAYAYVMGTTCPECRRHYAEFLRGQVDAILETANLVAEAHETKH
jgi:hypothetical protein